MTVPSFFEPLLPAFFFAPLKLYHYELLVIDPPWSFLLYSEKGNAKSASRHYAEMSDEDILALPVHELADANCLLFLWATSTRLPLAIECVRRWGFAYKSFMAWEKVTENGKGRMGPGYRVRTTAEPIVLAAKGEPKQTLIPRTIFRGVAREHSRKPEEFYALCDQVMPGARRADVFARTRRPGWDAFGNELDRFTSDDGGDDAVGA